MHRKGIAPTCYQVGYLVAVILLGLYLRYDDVSHQVLCGDEWHAVYVAGDLCETRSLYLSEPQVLRFKIDKYAMFGGHPIETNWLITFISLSLLIFLLGSVLSYKRLRQTIMRRK